jgi:hypothetical protein
MDVSYPLDVLSLITLIADRQSITFACLFRVLEILRIFTTIKQVPKELLISSAVFLASKYEDI